LAGGGGGGGGGASSQLKHFLDHRLPENAKLSMTATAFTVEDLKKIPKFPSTCHYTTAHDVRLVSASNVEFSLSDADDARMSRKTR
jgi:hypothetical protein